MHQVRFLFEDYCENGLDQDMEEVVLERQTYGVSLPDAIQYMLMHATPDGYDIDAYLSDMNDIADSVVYNTPMDDEETEAMPAKLEAYITDLTARAKEVIDPFLAYLRSYGRFVQVIETEGMQRWESASDVIVVVEYED